MSNVNDPAGTIPVEQAKEWAANWRAYLSSSAKDYETRSFSIPVGDINGILKYNPQLESIRAYHGLKTAGDSTSATLILVPVVEGAEVLTTLLEGEAISNVWDFVPNCPPNCPPVPGALER